MRRRLSALALGATLAIALAPAGPAEAAQIVAMDLGAGGGVPPRLARALNGLLLEELSRREGMSIVSQADVRALLALEANKQALGCTDTACMTEIAGSLGAELMISGELSLLGTTWVASLTLVRVAGAEVVRRASGQARGDEDVAAEALQTAVHNLFKGGLPEELLGPAAMTRRGFRAALAGHFQAVLDRTGDPSPVRRRIILDLVHTELDYDATPKLEELDLHIRRAIAGLNDRMLMAEDAGHLEHLLRGVEHYLALAHDSGRVKEIRQRARERGLAPSARPLRFEAPERGDRADPEAVARLFAHTAAAKTVVERALAAYRKGDVKAFTAEWRTDYAPQAQRTLESDRESDARYDYAYALLPPHAHPPRLIERGLEAMEKGQALVFLRKTKKGEIYGDEQVRLEKLEGRWRITSW
jgi:hypothetical protein